MLKYNQQLSPEGGEQEEAMGNMNVNNNKLSPSGGGGRNSKQRRLKQVLHDQDKRN